MIILALVTDAYGAGGGIAQYNRDLFLALANNEDVSVLAVLARHGRLDAAEVPAKVRLLGVVSNKLVFLWRALWALRQLRTIDAIFCGHLFMLPLAVVLSLVSAAPIWLQLHGIEAWQPQRLCGRYAMARVGLVTAVSRFTRRKFLGWAACDPARVKVLPNTVGEQFSPGAAPEALRARHGMTNKKVLLTVSRLAAAEQYKGHEHVMAALASPLLSGTSVGYLIAGDGDDHQRLQTLAHTLGVADRVKFIGHVPETELPALFRLADIFVMPSSGEGFGIVFLQALASGCRVIAGDADGSCDPLRDGRAGLLVPPRDAGAIAAAIARLLDDSSAPADNEPVFARTGFHRQIEQLLAGTIHV